MEEFVHQFGINWKMIIAQAINFGLLFGLLYKFAYKPVLGIMDERRKKIAEGLAMREKAEKVLGETEKKQKESARKSEEALLAAVSRGETLGKEKGERVLADAHTESTRIISEGKERAREEELRMEEKFRKEAKEVVRMAVAKIIEGSPDMVDGVLVEKALGAVTKGR